MSTRIPPCPRCGTEAPHIAQTGPGAWQCTGCGHEWADGGGPDVIVVARCKGCERGTASVPCPRCDGPACAGCGRCPPCDGPVPE